MVGALFFCYFYLYLRKISFQVYALTRERDTLRREQNKKSDAAALLKEKDEIITQVMAEGEKISKTGSLGALIHYISFCTHLFFTKSFFLIG